MFAKYTYELKNVKLFEQMSTSDIMLTLQHLSAYLKTYQAGDIICSENTSINRLGILISGKIQYKKDYLTGDCLTLNMIEGPNTFGEESACTNTSSPYTLCALETTTVIFVDSTKLLLMTPNSYPFMIPFLCNMMRLVANRNLSIQFQSNYSRITSLKKRVAIYLLEHYKASGQCLFTVRQTRCEMAAYLNATRPALSKVLAELKKEKIIDYYKDSFKIQDLNALMKQ